MSQWSVPSDSALIFTFGPWEVAIEAVADPSGQGIGDVLIVAWKDPGQGWDVILTINYQPADIAAAGGMGNWLLNTPAGGGPSQFAQINAALKTNFNTKPQLPQITNQTPYTSAALTELIDEYCVAQVSLDGTYPQLVLGAYNPNPALPGSPAQPAPPTIISTTAPSIGANGVTLTVNGVLTTYPLADWNGGVTPPTLTINGMVYQVIVT